MAVSEPRGFRAELERCVACGKCRAVCPVFAAEGAEASVARGKLKLLAAAEEGVLAYDADLGRLIDNCLGCRLCVEACPGGVRTDELLYAARERIHRQRGRGPLALFLLRWLLPRRDVLAAVAALVGRLQHWSARLLGLFRREADDNLSEGQRVQRALAGLYRLLLPLAGLSPRLVPPTLAREPFTVGRGELLNDAGSGAERWGLFVGCAIDLGFPTTAAAVVRLARLAGVTLVAPRGQVCCGLPAWGSGDRRAANQLRQRNVSAFSDRRLDGVLTACASCASFLREHYNDLLGQTLTLQEFLADKLERLPLRYDEGLTITWHQPCHLARHLGVELAEPLLERLGNYVEMDEKNICCGGAGSYFAKFPETAAAVGERKARHILASGADVVATACPGCAIQLEAALTRLGADIRVALLGELLVEHLPAIQRPPTTADGSGWAPRRRPVRHGFCTCRTHPR
jgi:glycolate oxidase iron-sulfur subunit